MHAWGEQADAGPAAAAGCLAPAAADVTPSTDQGVLGKIRSAPTPASWPLTTRVAAPLAGWEGSQSGPQTDGPDASKLDAPDLEEDHEPRLPWLHDNSSSCSGSDSGGSKGGGGSGACSGSEGGQRDGWVSSDGEERADGGWHQQRKRERSPPPHTTVPGGLEAVLLAVSDGQGRPLLHAAAGLQRER